MSPDTVQLHPENICGPECGLMYRHRYSAIAIKNLGPGKHCDGEGLYIVKRTKERGKWVLRYKFSPVTRELGLAGYPSVSLQEARETAEKWRRVIREGKDPKQQRAQERAQLAPRVHTFGQIAAEAFDVIKVDLKADGKAGKWMSPVNVHVMPHWKDRDVTSINQIDIRDLLAPIWKKKPDAARKAFNRTKRFFEHAAALGLDVDLNAFAKALQLLGSQDYKSKATLSMPWSEIPEFYQSLTVDTSQTSLALRLLILTGLRPRNIRECRLEHINQDVWTIPGDMMKGRKGKVEDFAVPLVPEALEVIEAAKAFEQRGNLFASRTGRTVLSDVALSKYLREQRQLPYTPHGFRASLRTWLDDQTEAPFEIKEFMLAHKERNQTARAYIRTDYLDERRRLLELWAQFCRGEL